METENRRFRKRFWLCKIAPISEDDTTYTKVTVKEDMLPEFIERMDVENHHVVVYGKTAEGGGE